ncbi:MAG: vWA domain-containing protein, partial [Candidatus Thermoplasmatota archaeon]
MAERFGPSGMGRKEFRRFLIVSLTMILVLSVFLPMLSSASEGSTSSAMIDGKNRLTEENEVDDNEEVQGWFSNVKEVQPADIWHSEVDPIGDADNPGKEPFGTNKTTVYLNLTAHGDPKEIVQPFDWVFSMDTSGSMGGDPIQNSIDGAQHFVDLVEEDVEGSRGATIDFAEEAQLVNNRHLTDDYESIRDDDLDSLEVPGETGYDTLFSPPLHETLDEFQQEGAPSRSWFHLFLTDGEGSIDWDLVDEHAAKDIPI